MQSMPTNLWEFAAPLQHDQRFGLLLALLLAIVVISGIIAALLYGMHKNRLNHALKRELLDRGMSAGEIATIVSARPGRHFARLQANVNSGA